MKLPERLPSIRSRCRLWLALLSFLLPSMALLPSDTVDGAPSPPYKTALIRWRAAANQFAGWQRTGVALVQGGALQLDPRSAQSATDPYKPRAYKGHNFYNGGKFLVGEATSPITIPAFAFNEAIPSWNAETPAGTWVETQLRVRIGTRWTRWYNMGVWAADSSTVDRHSVNGQKDADGTVSTDTLVLGTTSKPITANAFQVKVRLFSAMGATLPKLRNAAVTVSTTPTRPTTFTPGQRLLWGKSVPVPKCSQMVYRDGGEVWCSPTSISMALTYWKADGAPCEPRVRASVKGVYDWLYDGHGNWSFNTAYAATQGLETYVARFTSLSQAEPWIIRGVPVVISLGWGKGELTGAPLPSSSGHLMLLIGFDASGNPIVNDPAAPTNASVQRTYKRAELERLWLERSGGVVYIMFQPGWPVPTP